ncbi:hypothetical protein SMICM304S_01758 [Streptomyces microflavus]
MDRGAGVAVLVDLGSAVLTVKAMLAEGDELPENTRLVDAPFVEGAVAAVVTASSGGDIGAVEAAASEGLPATARRRRAWYGKGTESHGLRPLPRV